MAHPTDRFPLSWFCHGHEVYGVGTAAFSLAAEMHRRGWPVQLLHTHPGTTADRFADAGMHTRLLKLDAVPDTYGGSLPAKLWKFARGRKVDRNTGNALRSAIQDFGGKHFHVLWPFHVRAAVEATKPIATRCFWEMPNFVNDRYPFELNKRVYQRLCREGNVTVLADSAATGRTLAGRGVEPITFYHASRTDHFDPTRVERDRARLGLPESAAVFVIAARLVADKGGMHLLRAAAVHPTTPSGRPVHVALVGGSKDDAFPNELRRVADELGVADRLHLPGELTDVRPWYAAADVSCNLRVAPEPFGLSVIESMLMGVPVLVHAHGGPAETVRDGGTGWHITGMDQESVNAGMARVLADESRWPAFGESARMRGLTHFSDVALADHYERLLVSG
ncbi:MAG: glycosyltransferase family 4 protein [Planctomycetota bacterium]